MTYPLDASSHSRARTSDAPRGEARRSGFTFTRCIDLGKAEIVRAASSSVECRALLEHIAKIARPHDGAPLVLLLFARLATVASDWLDGDLLIVMEAIRPFGTRVMVATELGSGLREKVFPSFDMAVPLDEFLRVVERIPQMVHPLVADIAQDQLVLSAAAQVRSSTVPPEVRIDHARAAGERSPGGRSS